MASLTVPKQLVNIFPISKFLKAGQSPGLNRLFSGKNAPQHTPCPMGIGYSCGWIMQWFCWYCQQSTQTGLCRKRRSMWACSGTSFCWSLWAMDPGFIARRHFLANMDIFVSDMIFLRVEIWSAGLDSSRSVLARPSQPYKLCTWSSSSSWSHYHRGRHYHRGCHRHLRYRRHCGLHQWRDFVTDRFPP